jgi:kinase suppressor of Ras 2
MGVSLSQSQDDDVYSDAYDNSQDFPDDYRMMHRNSVDEWSIPYEEVRLVERVGRGPLGEVFRGHWHGQVAVKRFCLEDTTSDRDLLKFKQEVSILKKIRHHNLALFMGASFTLPNLAIITSFCRGNTLHKHLHVWSETFSLEKSVNTAKQVATGMGYLHARGIVHKGLHTRNVFLDKDKVVITDAGISSVGDSLCFPNRRSRFCVIAPRTKLYYLAPELMQEIACAPDVLQTGDVYHYTEKTDIYAFGTVFYEMLTRRYPFASLDATGYPLDVTMVIYQVGRGQRQDIPIRDAPKRVKDLIWDCWQLDPKKRIPFSTIWDILSKLSRKKTPIARSPSVPTALSRSSEDLLRLTLYK